MLALVVPLMLVFLVDGRRGVRQTWPIALVVGAAFAVTQWISASYISVELTDVIASLVGLAAAVIMLRFWQPVGREEANASLAEARQLEFATAGGGSADAGTAISDDDIAFTSAEEMDRRASDLTPGRIGMALLPYLLVIVVFAAAKLIDPIKNALADTDVKIPWPGLDGHVLGASGKVSSTTVYVLPWLSSPGSLLLICSVIVALVYQVSPAKWGREFVETGVKLRFAFLTVASVLALAYVMNLSGQTVTIGTWIAGTGAAFAFLSPILGWLGTAVTGSDTSANALFATLQQTAGHKAGIDPTLLVAGNSAGGVVGKMISPQNLTIAAVAVGLVGRESDILRKVILWSLGLLVIVCLLVGLQSTVLAWMLP